MTGVISRLSFFTLIVLCLPIVLMRFTGQQVNTMDGLGMFASVPDDERLVGEITYTDPLTQVGYTSPIYHFQRVRTQVDEQIISLYVQRTQLSDEIFVTEFDTQFKRFDVVWNSSSYLETIFIALWDGEAITSIDVYRVDVATSEVTFFASYDVISIPTNILLIDDHTLYIQTYDDLVIHNLQTDESFTDDADRSRMSGFEYGYYTQFGANSDGTNRHFIVHRETFTRIELALPTGTPIESLHTWGNATYQLLIEDITEQLWVYDLRTLEYHSIPPEYTLYGYVGTWSNAGDRLVVIQVLSDFVAEIGLYTVADGSYLAIHEHLLVSSGFQTPALPRVQWSPDDSVVFIAPQYINRVIDYILYDTSTGEARSTYSGLSESSSNKTFFWVTP